MQVFSDTASWSGRRAQLLMSPPRIWSILQAKERNGRAKQWVLALFGLFLFIYSMFLFHCCIFRSVAMLSLLAAVCTSPGPPNNRMWSHPFTSATWKKVAVDSSACELGHCRGLFVVTFVWCISSLSSTDVGNRAKNHETPLKRQML